MNLDEYQALKQRIDKLKQKVAMCEGAREQLMEQLRKEFNCSSVKDGRELLSKMEGQLDQLQKDFDEKYEKFIDAYGEYFGES